MNQAPNANVLPPVGRGAPAAPPQGRGRGGRPGRGRGGRGAQGPARGGHGRGHPAPPVVQVVNQMPAAPAVAAPGGAQAVPVVVPIPAAPAVVARTQVRVSVHVNAEQSKALAADWPSVEFVSPPNAGIHSHTLANISRRMLETEAYDWIMEQARLQGVINPVIVDIGGNVDRHVAAGRVNVHCCCPVLVPSDEMRARRRQTPRAATALGSTPWCTHRVEDCTCTPNVYAYLAVHSIYYLSPLLITRLASRATSGLFLSVHHRFPEYRGTLCHGELEYEHDDRDRVRCQVKFSPTSRVVETEYNHCDVEWLDAGYWSTPIVGSCTWKLLTVRMDTQIVAFTYARSGLVAPTTTPLRPVFSAVKDDSYRGGVDVRLRADTRTTPFLPTWIPAVVDESVVYSRGDRLECWRKDQRTIIVPKNPIRVLATQLSMKKRDKDTFQIAAQRAKAILQQYNMDPSEVADAVPFVVAYGFIYTLEQEVQALTSIVLVRAERMKILNRLLDWTVPERVRVEWYRYFFYMLTLVLLWRLVGLGLGFSILFRGEHSAFPQVYSWGASFGTQAAWLIGTLLYAPLWSPSIPAFWRSPHLDPVVVRIVHEAAQRDAVWSPLESHGPQWHPELFYVSDDVGPEFMTGVVLLAWMISSILFLRKRVFMALTFTDVCTDGVSIKEQDPTSEVKVPDDVECKPKFGCELLGYGVKHVAPRVFRQCVHNEAVAVMNRCTLRADADATTWKRVEDTVMTRIPEVFDLQHYEEVTGRPLAPLQPVAEATWLKRFPFGKRRVLAQALVWITSLFWAQVVLIKAFVKREHSVGNDNAIPRLIQGRTPWYQCYTGPITLALSNALKILWHGTHSICYTAGLNAEQLGEWFRSALAAFPEGYEIYEDDMSNYDGTLGVLAIAFELMLYALLFVVPVWCMVWLEAQLETRGFTRHGVSYKVKGKRKSGDGNTSGGNSLINGCVHACIMLWMGFWFKEFRMVVLGDDNLTICARNGRLRVEFVEAQLSSLGFKPKSVLRHSLYEAEFCSGRFWPVDEDGVETFVWVPKIGRVLSKTFWCLTKLSPMDKVRWLRGVALGFKDSCAHIPILRVVVASLLLQTAACSNPLRYRGDEFRANVTHRHEVCPRTWEMMFHLYGLTQEQVLRVEASIMTASYPAVLDYPELTSIVEVDIEWKPDFCEYVVEPSGPHPARVTQEVICQLGDRSLYPLYGHRTSRYLPVRHAGLTLFVTFLVAPVLEELIKRALIPILGWWVPSSHHFILRIVGSLIFGLFEGHVWGSGSGYSESEIKELMVLKAVQHAILGGWTLGVSIALHGLNNFVAFAMMQGVPDRVPLSIWEQLLQIMMCQEQLGPGSGPVCVRMWHDFALVLIQAQKRLIVPLVRAVPFLTYLP